MSSHPGSTSWGSFPGPSTSSSCTRQTRWERVRRFRWTRRPSTWPRNEPRKRGRSWNLSTIRRSRPAGLEEELTPSKVARSIPVLLFFRSSLFSVESLSVSARSHSGSFFSFEAEPTKKKAKELTVGGQVTIQQSRSHSLNPVSTK